MDLSDSAIPDSGLGISTEITQPIPQENIQERREELACIVQEAYELVSGLSERVSKHAKQAYEANNKYLAGIGDEMAKPLETVTEYLAQLKKTLCNPEIGATYAPWRFLKRREAQAATVAADVLASRLAVEPLKEMIAYAKEATKNNLEGAIENYARIIVDKPSDTLTPEEYDEFKPLIPLCRIIEQYAIADLSEEIGQE